MPVRAARRRLLTPHTVCEARRNRNALKSYLRDVPTGKAIVRYLKQKFTVQRVPDWLCCAFGLNSARAREVLAHAARAKPKRGDPSCSALRTSVTTLSPAAAAQKLNSCSDRICSPGSTRREVSGRLPCADVACDVQSLHAQGWPWPWMA
jgi:hypothetical protein